MKGTTIAGIVLLVLGAVVLLWGASFGSKRDVLQVGDLKVTATEQRPVPPWVGGAALIVGVGLLVAGTRKRS